MVCTSSKWGCLWPSSFLLGIAVFAPLEALMLCIDYYADSFPGAQAAVKLSAAYDGLLTCTQLLCYCCESYLRRWGHQRIVWRHGLVACLLGLLVVYDRCIVGAALPPPAWTLDVLIAITAAIGALDGISIGAVYGEVGIAGPGPAQAVVAGHSFGFLLLVALRVLTKLAMPATRDGLRISVCIYFAVTGVLLLLALAAYMWIIRPVVAAAASDRMGPKLAKELDTVPFGAVISSTSGLRFAPSPSSRGTSLSMHLVHTGLSPKTLNSIQGSLSISPSLFDAPLPQYELSTSTKGVTSPRAPGSALSVLALAQHNSAASSAITSAGGSEGMSPRSGAKTPRRAKKLLTFKLPADVEEEDGDSAAPAAEHRDAKPQTPDQQQQQQQSRGALFQAELHALNTSSVPTAQNLVPTAAWSGGATEAAGTLTALTPEAAPAPAAAGTGGEMQHGTASATARAILNPPNKDEEALPAAAVVPTEAAGTVSKTVHVLDAAASDQAPQAEDYDSDEATAWATVIQVDGSTYGSTHGSTTDPQPVQKVDGSTHGSTKRSEYGSQHGSQYHGGEPDALSPFQYAHLQSFGKRLFGTIKSMRTKKFGVQAMPSTLSSGAPLSSRRCPCMFPSHSSGVTLSQLRALKSGKLAFEEVTQLGHATPEVIYAVPGRSVISMTRAIVGDSWAFCLGIFLSYLAQFLILPALYGFVTWDAVGSWYPLLLQISQGLGDLVGKLMPVWIPARPQAAMGTIASVRMLLVPVILLGLYYSAGPAFFLPMVFILLLSAWYETSIFAMACNETSHPDDVYQVESLLAFMIQLGSLSGALLSMLLSYGPWPAGASEPHA